MLKDTLKRTLEGTPLYSPARDAYQAVFNRTYWKHRSQMIEFYSQFCSKGDLVFDVGANIGSYTELFLRLGARVVAIEPNPDCAAKISALRPRSKFVVENVAVGNAETVAPLFLCDDSDTHSTLSSEWIGVALKTPRLAEKRWARTVEVPVTKLDSLIAKHGEPRFIKVDVEGFEREVLSGLLRSPKYLSFEFVSEFVDAAIECVKKDCFRGSTYFNFIFDEAPRPSGSIEFELKEWMPAEQMVEVLSSAGIRDAKTYGEIFVRRCA